MLHLPTGLLSLARVIYAQRYPLTAHIGLDFVACQPCRLMVDGQQGSTLELRQQMALGQWLASALEHTILCHDGHLDLYMAGCSAAGQAGVGTLEKALPS